MSDKPPNEDFLCDQKLKTKQTKSFEIVVKLKQNFIVCLKKKHFKNNALVFKD